MEIKFEVPTHAHIEELKDGLSLEDRNELLAIGVGPDWGIPHSVAISLECVAVTINGKLVCITGVVQDTELTDHIYPWLLGTPLILKHRREVARYTRIILTRWMKRFPYMYNFVDLRHTRALAWLAHFGASFELVSEYGPYRRPFYKFSFGSES